MEVKDIQNQFNIVAKKYDENRRKFIPCFDGFYLDTTDFIASNIDNPKSVLDLGAGTGILTSFWYQNFPKSNYTLVDIAEDMLRIARERFCGMTNIEYLVEDYTKKLPDRDFDLIISALSIHHLEHAEKIELFKRIFEKLPVGGVFVNYDQFCAGSEALNNWYDVYWENGFEKSGLSKEDISLWKERRKLDRECSVEQQSDMLKDCGFEIVKCVYTMQKFSVTVAIK